MSNRSQFTLGFSILLIMFFFLDLYVHVLLVPSESLVIRLISFRGDIAFNTLGLVNILLRFLLLVSFFFQHKVTTLTKLSYLALHTLILLFLMVNTFDLFFQYVSLYGYWMVQLLSMILFAFFILSNKAISFKSSLWPLLFIPLIALVYFDIMGVRWPLPFVYSFIQHAFFEGILFVIFLLSLSPHKGEQVHDSIY
jgi:hypothetical protein